MSVLICEDEPFVARRLQRFLTELFPKGTVINYVNSIPEVNIFLSSNNIKVLFLDLNLHGQDGFEILKKFLNRHFQTIIVSAYTEQALTAFEYGVLDFVPKPFTKDRLAKAIDRLNSNKAPNEIIKHLSVKDKDKLIFIDISEIKYIKASSNYSEIYLTDASWYLQSKSLNSLMLTLPSIFIRVHKSYAINKSFLKAIKTIRHNTYSAVLEGDVEIPISREKRKELVVSIGK